MKANQPKRKLFNDAVDLLTGDAPDSGIQMISVDQIKPFHEHPFKLYQGGGHHVHQQAKSRELIGQEYGMTGRNIARYVRCNQLIPAFKKMLNDGSMTLVSGVELSFLSEGEQELVSKVMEQNGVRVKGNMAKKLKAVAGTITEETVQSILALDKIYTEARKKGTINVKVSGCSVPSVNL